MKASGVLTAVVALAAAVVLGCATPVPPPSAVSSASPAASAAQDSPSSVVVATAPAATTFPSSGAVVACRAQQLGIGVVNPGGGAGTAGAYLVFTNHGAAPCALHGWPKLRGIAKNGRSTVASRSDSLLTFPNVSGAPRVVLPPGRSAVAAFAGTDTPGPSGTCPPPYHTLEVAAPGQATTVLLPGFNAWLGQDTPACAGLAVTMVVPASDPGLDFLELSPRPS